MTPWNAQQQKAGAFCDVGTALDVPSLHLLHWNLLLCEGSALSDNFTTDSKTSHIHKMWADVSGEICVGQPRWIRSFGLFTQLCVSSCKHQAELLWSSEEAVNVWRHKIQDARQMAKEEGENEGSMWTQLCCLDLCLHLLKLHIQYLHRNGSLSTLLELILGSLK